ncbi:MAG: LacI family DNA-binding transcriptional regulator [Acetivibrionales bacterium]|jgi:LacI family transcriptional regulator
MSKPTMNDVAKLAGVSQSTVSFVLNNAPIAISAEVRQRILDAVEALGYTPRARTRTVPNTGDKLIVLIIPNASNAFYMELTRHINYFVLQKGYRLLIVNTNRSASEEQDYLKILCSNSEKIAGIIYGFTPSVSDFSQLISNGIPLVVIGEMVEHADISLVTLDSLKSGEMVANHLLSLGHKDIVYITSPTRLISLSRERRLNGIQRAVEGKGNLTVLSGGNETEFEPENYEVEIGYQLTKEYYKHQKPSATAFIGANDMIAFGIIKALNEMSVKIPKEVSVCGFDNILFSSLTNPSLTTVDHCTYWRCSMAVDILVNKKNKKLEVPPKINYDPVLIVRNSSGPAPKVSD